MKQKDCAVFAEVVWDAWAKTMSENDLEDLFFKLPEKIQDIAYDWGFKDRTFQREAEDWLVENKNEIFYNEAQ